MARFEFISWLYLWFLETTFFEFEWDTFNTNKIVSKHEVFPVEVEEVFLSEDRIVFGRQIQPYVAEERFGLMGKTLAGRLLVVVFVIRNNVIRVVSARPGGRRDKKLYEKIG